MRPADDVLASHITVAEALQQVRSSALGSWLVVGRQGGDTEE